MLNAHPTANFTTALQAGNAWRMETRFLMEQSNADLEIKALIFDYFSQFINHISQKVTCSKFHLIENRLCTWLLMLQDRTGNRLKLTHEQIALSLGTNRPTITQITQKLREEEMIDYMRGKISIRNRRRLEAAACSCYMPVY